MRQLIMLKDSFQKVIIGRHELGYFFCDFLTGAVIAALIFLAVGVILTVGTAALLHVWQ